jgi:hypothetical protein
MSPEQSELRKERNSKANCIICKIAGPSGPWRQGRGQKYFSKRRFSQRHVMELILNCIVSLKRAAAKLIVTKVHLVHLDCSGKGLRIWLENLRILNFATHTICPTNTATNPNLSWPALGCPFIRHIFFIRIMNIFDLLFEYSNNIRIFILLNK